MKTVTAAQFHSNLDNLLQEVLDTAISLEISKGEQRLRVIPVMPVDKFANLVQRPYVINGDSEEIAHLNWQKLQDFRD